MTSPNRTMVPSGARLLLIVPALLIGCGNGDDTAGGSSAPPDVGLTCEAGQAQVALDGAAAETFALGAWTNVWSQADGFMLKDDIGGGGWYMVDAIGKLDASGTGLPSVVPTTPQTIEKVLIAPYATDQSLGRVFWVGQDSGSTVRRDGDQIELSLMNAAVIESCAGNPVAGEINLCLNFSGCGDTFDGGQLAGTAWTAQPDTWAGGMGSYTMTLDDGTFIRAMRSPFVEDGAPIYWALIFTSAAGPGAGQILCAGIDSTVSLLGTSPSRYDVWHLRGLNTFAGVSGAHSVAACLQHE